MAAIAPVFAILGASLFNKNTFYSTTITGNSLVYLKKKRKGCLLKMRLLPNNFYFIFT